MKRHTVFHRAIFLALAVLFSVPVTGVAADTQVLREDIDAILARIEIIDAASGGRSAGAIADARQRIQTASDEVLGVLAPNAPAIAVLKHDTEALANQVLSTAGGPTPTRQLPRSAGLPDAQYYTDSLCTGVRFDTGNLKIAWNTFQAARTVLNAAEFVCEQDILGENTALACVPFAVAIDVAEQVIENYNFCDDDVDSAEIQGSYLRIGHVHEDLAVTQETLDGIVLGQIEEDLARVRFYQAEFILPAQYGGKLEIVRDVVANVIDRMELAGMYIDHARDHLSRGDAWFAAQEWKRAHMSYGIAYRKAVGGKN